MTLVVASTDIHGHLRVPTLELTRVQVVPLIPTHIPISHQQQEHHLSQQRGCRATEPLRQLELGVGLES